MVPQKIYIRIITFKIMIPQKAYMTKYYKISQKSNFIYIYIYIYSSSESSLVLGVPIMSQTKNNARDTNYFTKKFTNY